MGTERERSYQPKWDSLTNVPTAGPAARPTTAAQIHACTTNTLASMPHRSSNVPVATTQGMALTKPVTKRMPTTTPTRGAKASTAFPSAYTAVLAM